MKKTIYSIAAALCLLGSASCSDMLDVDSTRMLTDLELNQKTDSAFFAFGIMQAMQQCADQYVYQGEMRGDVTAPTQYAVSDLQRMARFERNGEIGAYDSAYVYYRVINNCNYYINHRDTTLLTGSTHVAIPEYAAVKAIRAWAYLQLVRNYGSVPFFTDDLTAISQVNSANYPEVDINGLAAKIAPDLAQYSGMPVPTFAGDPVSIGSLNQGGDKKIRRNSCFIPVDVILGELLLESGDYAGAAKYLSNFLFNAPAADIMQTVGCFSPRFGMGLQPRDYDGSNMGKNSTNYTSIFGDNPTTDIISYIPMAVNKQQGTVSTLPAAYGYDIYSTDRNKSRVDNVPLQPSTQYKELVESQDYYYYQESLDGLKKIGVIKGVGDQRYRNITSTDADNASDEGEVDEEADKTVRMATSGGKFSRGNVVLYRYATVYMYLAEAFNRMGHPDLAFAILKEGINKNLVKDHSDITDFEEYITPESRKLLTETYPFFGETYADKFATATDKGYGIHSRGCGITSEGDFPGRSPYTMRAIVGQKLDSLSHIYPALVKCDKTEPVYGLVDVEVPATDEDGNPLYNDDGTPQTQPGKEIQVVGQRNCYSKQDSINAVEDLLADEYAMEFAFEGRRFFDLARLARHKNGGDYGATFGNLWFADKMKFKTTAANLTDQRNWYLPFKK